MIQVELLPRPPVGRDDRNPWPQWPMIFRTSSSQEEGGRRDFALRTTRLSGEGRLERLHAVRVDHPGGEELSIEVDLLTLALGFVGPEVGNLTEELGVSLDSRGNVAAAADFATSAPGIYAAGDARRGASLIVWAISEGREAARSIDAFLREGPSVLPARGADCSFGGKGG